MTTGARPIDIAIMRSRHVAAIITHVVVLAAPAAALAQSVPQPGAAPAPSGATATPAAPAAPVPPAEVAAATASTKAPVSVLAIPPDAPQQGIRASVSCMGDGSGEHRWDPNGTDYRFTDLAACFITLTRSDASQDKVVEIRPKGGGAAVVKMPPFASGAKEYKIDGNDYAAKLADDTEYYLYVGDDRAFAFEKRTSRWRFAVTPKVAGAYSFDGSAAYFVPAITAGVGFVTKRGDEGSAISLRAVFGAGPNLINGSKQQTNAATGQPETVPDTSKPIQFLIGGEVVLARYLSIGYAAVAGKNRPDTGVLLFSYGDLYPAPLNAGQ